MKAELDALTQEIISAAIAVHRELGPGGLESTYEQCLNFELGDRRLRVERQKPIPVVYRGRRLDCGYRLDLFVEEKVIVEVKAVRRFAGPHGADDFVPDSLATKRRVTLQLSRKVVRGWRDKACGSCFPRIACSASFCEFGG